MQKAAFLVSLVVITAAFFVKPLNAAEPGTTEHLISWLTGDFTNYQDTIEAPEDVALPVFYSIKTIHGEKLNQPTFVTTQTYLFADEGVPRKQILALSEWRGGWRQSVYEIDPKLSEQEVVDPSNWQRLDGCRIQWRWHDGYYQGTRDSKRCYFILEETGERVGVGANLILSQLALRIEEVLESPGQAPLLLANDLSINNFHRMTYYEADVQYRVNTQDNWATAEPVKAVHDQGPRVGLVVEESGLELRYQFLLRREGEEVHFEVYDLSRNRMVHEQVFSHSDAVEFISDDFKVRLRPLN